MAKGEARNLLLVRNLRGKAAIHVGVERGYIEVINKLTAGSSEDEGFPSIWDLPVIDDIGARPLHLAAESGNLHVFINLLEAGADMTATTKPMPLEKQLHGASGDEQDRVSH